MVFGDVAYQYFDWWHEMIPEAIDINGNQEDFNHYGLFKNKAINLGLTVGLNDYWNITISQMISERCMEWEGPVDEDGNSLTVHHRTECSSSDFFDDEKRIAFGGYLGDARINFRYLLFNQAKGPGPRFFLGIGFDIPSPNVITESPWKKIDITPDDGIDNPVYTPHRHFYLSDGAYKMNLELQFFKKRMQYPVFWGGTLSGNFPLNDSRYGFSPSPRYQLSLLAMSSSLPFKKIKLGKLSISSVGFTFTVAHAGRSKWEGLGDTPNSKSILYVPGINVLFGLEGGGGFGLNLTRGFEYYFNENESDIEEKTKIYGISLSYRKVLDKVIDKLYWGK
ncbi:MAG: hypothetical protein CMG66_04815 [Candidatus Marinimicrobia bacterium]|nr:hypothetical protein [Candidatus Neomarinimicrobiota bacterium]|tara:strand:+ start:20716 stop:21723 length:1008 start_codon:yes stop_codon:yes gene_type:complete